MIKSMIVTVALFLAVSATCSAAEWHTAELSGEFRGYGTHNKGKGKTQYSFALQQPCESSGDVLLEVTYGNDDITVGFRLNGYWFVDLGSKTTPPDSISLPKDFATSSWSTKEPAHMTLGHYYVLSKSQAGHSLLIQVLDFKCTNRKRVVSGFFNNTYNATCFLSFRYFTPAQSLAELNSLLSGTPIKTHSVPSHKAGSGKKPVPDQTRHTTRSVEPLFAEYEGFQESTSAFLDLPLDQVSVVKCDQLIDTGTAVKSKVGQEITSLHEQIREGTADVEKYKDRIKRITNLQLKDRVTTKINQLVANNQERRVKLKKWEARQNELDTSLRTLREYRDILK